MIRVLFFTRSIKKIVTIISKRQPLFVCDIPLLESCFTKPLCFEKLELTEEKYKTSNQIIATYFCFLVTPTTRKFMAEWLSFCCDLELLSPAGLANSIQQKKRFRRIIRCPSRGSKHFLITLQKVWNCSPPRYQSTRKVPRNL